MNKTDHIIADLNVEIDKANKLINQLYNSGCLNKYEENLVREYFGLEVYEEPLNE